ncbi:hypothetical protein, partial [uncultured Campylobacter sp.]|uniref:hypothetical protein n=1 Tax=uncultured Campylobacter sp. TaxID=218934 RepID=UPI00260ED196
KSTLSQSSAVEFLCCEILLSKIRLCGISNFTAQIPRRRIFYAFTKYKICEARSNSEILKFRNFKIWRYKNLSTRHGILPLKFNGAKLLSTKFTVRI